MQRHPSTKQDGVMAVLSKEPDLGDTRLLIIRSAMDTSDYTPKSSSTKVTNRQPTLALQFGGLNK